MNFAPPGSAALAHAQELRRGPLEVLWRRDAALVLAGDLVEAIDPRRHREAVLLHTLCSCTRLRVHPGAMAGELLQVPAPEADHGRGGDDAPCRCPGCCRRRRAPLTSSLSMRRIESRWPQISGMVHRRNKQMFARAFLRNALRSR